MKRKYVIAIVSVVTALVVVVGGIFAYKQYTLMKAKDTAIEKISDVNYSDYREKEQKEIKALVKDGKAQIDEAKSKEAVNIIAKNMKSDIDKVKTAAEIKTAEAQNKAIKSLNSCINKSNYRSEEKKQVEKIISEYTKKIRKETDEKTIRKLLEEGKSKLGDIKTDSQYESEESAASVEAPRISTREQRGRTNLCRKHISNNFRIFGFSPALPLWCCTLCSPATRITTDSSPGRKSW